MGGSFRQRVFDKPGCGKDNKAAGPTRDDLFQQARNLGAPVRQTAGSQKRESLPAEAATDDTGDRIPGKTEIGKLQATACDACCHSARDEDDKKLHPRSFREKRPALQAMQPRRQP